MHTNLDKLNSIKIKVNELINKKKLNSNPNIIVVSKTFSLDKINSIIESGHIHFGENKLQEAEKKWSDIKKINKNLQLHMIGKLQSNKAKKAVELFEYIHSLDSEKLAKKIEKYSKDINKNIKLFIQVNLGDEQQKAGVELKDLESFFNFCTKDLSLNIIGLMCIPPANAYSANYFKTLHESADKLNLKELSMGMSSDFEDAIINGATFLRLGSIILGQRDINL